MSVSAEFVAGVGVPILHSWAQATPCTVSPVSAEELLPVTVFQVAPIALHDPTVVRVGPVLSLVPVSRSR